jgi:hypothetical protein
MDLHGFHLLAQRERRLGNQRPQETETVIRSVRLVSVGEQEQAPVPLVRVMTCGLLTLEIAQERVSADPPQSRYAVVTPDRLRGRGVGQALSLLKLLLSRPQRLAPADWLLEQFCRGEGEAFSSKRLDTLALQQARCAARGIYQPGIRGSTVGDLSKEGPQHEDSQNCPGHWERQEAGASRKLIWRVSAKTSVTAGWTWAPLI